MTGPTGEAETAFCIACGDPHPVADGKCIDCLREGIEVLKAPSKPVEVERCVHCGAVPIRDHWDQPTSLLETIEQTALGAVLIPEELADVELGVTVQQEDDKNYIVLVDVHGEYKGVAVEGESPVKVRVKNVTCDTCSRRHGGYYEAIVQVRQEGDEEVLADTAGEITKMIEEEVRRVGGLSGSRSYLLKAEARHGGYDYFFGAKPVAKAVAKRIADRYGGSTTQSSTLAGQEDGQEKYRLTLAVRLPRVGPGSVVAYDDEVIELYGRQGNRLLGKTVPEGEGRTIEERKLEHARILEPKRLDVVYAEAGEGQVLDPETYDSVQVRLPQGMASGDKVWAVRHDRTWVVLGPAEGEATTAPS